VEVEKGIDLVGKSVEKTERGTDFLKNKNQLNDAAFVENRKEEFFEKSHFENGSNDTNKNHSLNSISNQKSFLTQTKKQPNATISAKEVAPGIIPPFVGLRNQTLEKKDLSNKSQSNFDLQNLQDLVNLPSQSSQNSYEETGFNSLGETKSSRENFAEISQLSNKSSFIIPKINLENPPVSITLVKKKARKKNIKIGVFGGTTLLSNFYGENTENSDLNEVLKNTHQGVAGYSASTKIYWNALKKVDVISGFEYLNTVTKFDYLKTGQPEKVSRDGRPGIDSVLTVPTRKVVHFNHQNFISVPVLVGSSYQFGKFGIGANGGIGINFFTNQTGKTLNASTKIENIETAAVLPFKKTFISYQLNPYFNFRATEKLQFQLQSTFRYQSHRMSDFYGLKHYSILGGLSFGMMITP